MKSGNRWPAFIFHPATWSNRRGAALLIALTFLVLLSAVVLALFGTTRTDRQNASTFATGQETMRLADAAVSLVQGQIRDATIQPRVGWASQPGMVRAFDASGNVTAYKLYSDDEMVVSNFGQSQINAETAAMATWNTGATSTSYNALYCDLNSPAAVKRPKPGDETETEDALVFPIADPAAMGAVEGFSANTSVVGTVLGNATTRRLPMPVKWIYVLRDGQMTAPTSGDSSRVTFSGTPLPTQSNPIVGRIAFWADDETCKLNINTASEGTFWDTPKTASWTDLRMAVSLPLKGEFQRLPGHPSTTSLSPVFGSFLPRPPTPFIRTQTAPNPFTSLINTPAGVDYYKQFASYYNITPRISWRTSAGDHFDLASLSTSTDESSRGGIQRIALTGAPGTSEQMNGGIWPSADQGITRKAIGKSVLPDSDRLYATPDEILFKPDRSINNPAIGASELASRNFFITAQSRAPETTLFGTPRISLWPINDSAAHQNVRDRLLDFASTIGSTKYSFSRRIGSNAILSGSQPSDLTTEQSGDSALAQNQNLTGYLVKLCSTPLPGFSMSLADKWADNGLKRVVAQTFDFVRSNINADYVNFGGAGGGSYRYSVSSRNPTDFLNGSNDFQRGPRGTVVPSDFGNGILGGGRFVYFSQFALLFMPTEIENTYSDITVGGATWSGTETIFGDNDGWLKKDGSPAITYNPPLPGGTSFIPGNVTVTSQKTTKMRAVLLMQPYSPHGGRPAMSPACSVEISGFNALSAQSISFGVANTPIVTDFGTFHAQAGNHASQAEWSAIYPMSEVGALWPFMIPDGPAAGRVWRKFPRNPTETAFSNDWKPAYDPLYHYGFISQEIDVASLNNGNFNFSGGQIDVKIYPWSSRQNRTNNALVQSLSVNFDPQSLAVPRLLDSNGNFGRGPTTSLNQLQGRAFSITNDILSSLFSENEWFYLSFWKRMRANISKSPDESIARIIRRGDTVIAKEFSATNSDTKGDFRILALTKNITASYFSTPPNGQSLRGEGGSLSTQGKDVTQYGWVGDRLRYQNETTGSGSLTGGTYVEACSPYVAAGLGKAEISSNVLGDWQSGVGNVKDGAFFGREDSGDSAMTLGGYFESKGGSLNVGAGDTWEPNRFVPSAGIFGRFLTTDSSGSLVPWQTLLFAANPAAGDNHPGFGIGVGGSGKDARAPFSKVPDHVYLDNFWMPIVEPYPISEPLSTAGKVNLNFQMAPFSHITRSTALRGALKPVLVAGVDDRSTQLNFPANNDKTYKTPKWVDGINMQTRFEISANQTISEFQRRFDAGDIFRASTEVSTVSLVPQDQIGDPISVSTFWNDRKATSDTLREQPYTALLSRVTTKSNTFTVHYRVQALKQPPRAGRNWAEWDEARDQVVGEYRGSTTIERFLDSNAQNIPDYTQVNLSGNYDPIDKFYRWRVLSQKQFAP